MSSIKQYDASAIDVLNGLEAIRKRPDMYIGPTSGQSLIRALYEMR